MCIQETRPLTRLKPHVAETISDSSSHSAAQEQAIFLIRNCTGIRSFKTELKNPSFFSLQYFSARMFFCVNLKKKTINDLVEVQNKLDDETARD